MDYEIAYILLRVIADDPVSCEYYADEIKYIKDKYTKISRCDGEYCGDDNSDYCTTRKKCKAEHVAAEKIKTLLEETE